MVRDRWGDTVHERLFYEVNDLFDKFEWGYTAQLRGVAERAGAVRAGPTARSDAGAARPAQIQNHRPGPPADDALSLLSAA